MSMFNNKNHELTKGHLMVVESPEIPLSGTGGRGEKWLEGSSTAYQSCPYWAHFVERMLLSAIQSWRPSYPSVRPPSTWRVWPVM
jgi:hypothetical protein